MSRNFSEQMVEFVEIVTASISNVLAMDLKNSISISHGKNVIITIVEDYNPAWVFQTGFG